MITLPQTYTVPVERQPYTYEGGSTGILILHGFLGSPGSSRPLGKHLAEFGFTVHCPLLPGHGEFPNKLIYGSKDSWLDTAEESLDFMKGRCDKIFLLGHSMGTVLSAFLAVNKYDPGGLIMLAPVDKVPDIRLKAFRFLKYVMPWLYPMNYSKLRPIAVERMQDYDPEIDLDDPETISQLPEITKVPTASLDEMRQTVEIGRSLWPMVSAPTIIIQGGLDIAAGAEDARRIYDQISATDKGFYLLDSAGHELMRPNDPNHQQVWKLITEFVKEHSSQGGSGK